MVLCDIYLISLSRVSSCVKYNVYCFNVAVQFSSILFMEHFNMYTLPFHCLLDSLLLIDSSHVMQCLCSIFFCCLLDSLLLIDSSHVMQCLCSIFFCCLLPLIETNALLRSFNLSSLFMNIWQCLTDDAG